jgi:hypothetical protein
MIGWLPKNTLASPDPAQAPGLDLVAATLAGLAPVTIVNARIDPPRPPCFTSRRASSGLFQSPAPDGINGFQPSRV